MIGILSIQGGVEEHEAVLDRLGLTHKRVRSLKDTDGLTGFIIPGGESTVMDMFMQKYGLRDWLIQRLEKNPDFAILGTCAGLILLARYGILDAEVERNAYGKQTASFTETVEVNGLGSVKAHFIRAPKIRSVSELTEVLAGTDDGPVLVRKVNVWGATFHPELAGETLLHRAIFS